MRHQRKYKKALWTQLVKPKPDAKVARRREYVKLARATVQAMIRAGHTCPVVDSIPELQNGMRYGHKISNKLNEVHHVRGRLGDLLLDVRYWLCVSRIGHRWIHSNVEEARRRGWICQKGLWNKL